MDITEKVALCTYGRDEEYINNKLWINGISSIILFGAGDGMILWCALQKRIPIMVLYDSELHKSTLETFLVGKIQQKMEEAAPGDARWWRTNAQLGCRAEEASDVQTQVIPKPKPKPKPNGGKHPPTEPVESAGSFLSLMGS